MNASCDFFENRTAKDSIPLPESAVRQCINVICGSGNPARRVGNRYGRGLYDTGDACVARLRPSQ